MWVSDEPLNAIWGQKRSKSLKFGFCNCGKTKEIKWNNFDNFSTGLLNIPFLADKFYIPPYMGVCNEGFFEHMSDLSTLNTVYPQFIASYPQVSLLEKTYQPPYAGRGFSEIQVFNICQTI